ncbi:MAG: hypothetical protein QXT48_04810 [Thermoplasmatales archaeon]
MDLGFIAIVISVISISFDIIFTIEAKKALDALSILVQHDDEDDENRAYM